MIISFVFSPYFNEPIKPIKMKRTTAVANAELIVPHFDTNDLGVFILHSMDVATFTQISANMTIPMVTGSSVILPKGSIVEMCGVSVKACTKMISIPVQ